MTLVINLHYKEDYQLDRLYQVEGELHSSLRAYRHHGITTTFLEEGRRELVITDLNISLRNFVLSFLKIRDIIFDTEEQTEEGHVVH